MSADPREVWTEDQARKLDQLSPADRIRRALDERLRRVWPFEEHADVDLVLDAGGVGCWTIWARGKRVFVSEGRTSRPTSVVEADAATLLDLLEGRRSGVELWLDNRLRVRGSIALSMKLEGLLGPEGRPRRFPRPKRVMAHGIDTFYLDAGAGPPVILLHGLGATNASMLPTLLDLARDHRVIAPDIPGFGDSSKPVRDYHAGFFAKWAVALLDALGLERAHFIGNSMGGRIAIEVGLRSPERVESLVLYAPAVAFRRLRQLVPVARMLRPELAAVPMLVPRAMVVGTLERLFSKSSRVEAPWFLSAADEFLRIFATRRGRVAFFSAARQIYLDHPWGDRGFWQRLAKLEPRSLFIWGDRDFLIPPGFSRHVARAVPHATSVVLDDCGHVPQFERPRTTHQLVREFFRG